jgi:hypothetical protein
VAFLFGIDEMIEANAEGMLEKRVTMLFAGGMGFCASKTCVVTLISGVVEISTSFTGTPLQRTPEGHLTQGLVPVILPVLM